MMGGGALESPSVAAPPFLVAGLRRALGFGLVSGVAVGLGARGDSVDLREMGGPGG